MTDDEDDKFRGEVEESSRGGHHEEKKERVWDWAKARRTREGY